MDFTETIGRLKTELDFLPGSYDRKPAYRTDFHPVISKEIIERIEGGQKSLFAAAIDHTVLKPEAQPKDAMKLAAEAKLFDFCAVCVNPQHVAQIAESLKGTKVKTASVVGFPLGAYSLAGVAAETAQAVKDGACEIDMVIPVGLLKAKEYSRVYDCARAVVEAAGGAAVKVIIETCLLTDEEKIAACLISLKADAEFVKTSTGFSTGGATEHDVALMRQTVGLSAGVKASGGVKTPEAALAMLKAGANRIGTSSGTAIIGA